MAPRNAAALFQQHADTTALPIKGVFSCPETTKQGIAARKLEKDTSEELLGIPQVFLPAAEEGENCRLQKYYSLCC